MWPRSTNRRLFRRRSSKSSAVRPDTIFLGTALRREGLEGVGDLFLSENPKARWNSVDPVNATLSVRVDPRNHVVIEVVGPDESLQCSVRGVPQLNLKTVQSLFRGEIAFTVLISVMPLLAVDRTVTVIFDFSVSGRAVEADTSGSIEPPPRIDLRRQRPGGTV